MRLAEVPVEEYLNVVAHCPNLLEMVRKVEEGGLDRVIMTIDAFAGEPDLFYEAMRLLSATGVTVMLASTGRLV